MRSLKAFVVSIAMIVCFSAVARADVFNMGASSMQFVTVGSPGNAGDTTVNLNGHSGYGSVGYTYQMGKFDVTAAQYTQFLNAVAKSDPYGLYASDMSSPGNEYRCNILQSGASGNYTYSVAADYANRPVTSMTWASAARFCNWLSNGQKADPTTTETGSYTLNGSTNSQYLLTVTRNADAKYALPSRNEWYKAAYYDPNKPGGAGYWMYPTKSDTAPTNQLPGGANGANYHTSDAAPMTIGAPYYRTNVGEFTNTTSAWGAYDMAGNVNQATDTRDPLGSNGFSAMGGDFSHTANFMKSNYYGWTISPTYANDSGLTGFRIVETPEPATMSLLALGGLALLKRRKK